MSVIKKEIGVEGMSCNHCVNAVKTALKKIDGVGEVIVSLENKKVTVEYDTEKVSQDDIKTAIEDQGYDVVC